MNDIKIGRYKHPKAIGWAGWMEPEDKTWIAFIGLDGRPVFFLNRDLVTGAILGDDPDHHEAEIAAVKAEGGLRIGMPNDGSDADLAIGEPVFPLGVDGTGGAGI